MKEKRKRIPVIPLGIIMVDDPLSETNTPENREIFNKWVYETISARLKSYDGPTIVLQSPKIKEDMRTSPPKKTSLRLELEAYVYAWNTALKDAVKTMNIVILLRNAHPAYRSVFASQAFEIGLISKQQRKEFVVGPPVRQHSRTNWAS